MPSTCATFHGSRFYWLGQVAPRFAEPLSSLYSKPSEDEWVSSRDLPKIQSALKQSSAQLRSAMETMLVDPKPVGPYSHPLFFMQHMLWHEGWHVAEVIQALRVGGSELSEEWEQENIWGVWRA